MGFEATHTADTEVPISLGKSCPQGPLSRQRTQNDFKNQKFWCVLFVFLCFEIGSHHSQLTEDEN